MDIQAVALDLLPSRPALSTLFIWPDEGPQVCFRPTLTSSSSLESLHLQGVSLAKEDVTLMSECLPGLVNLCLMELDGVDFTIPDLLREVYDCVMKLTVRGVWCGKLRMLTVCRPYVEP